MGHVSAIFEIFSRGFVKTAFKMSICLSRKNSFGRFFLLLWDIELKLFGFFVGDFLAELSNRNIRMQGHFLRTNTFIREKKQFLLSCWDTDPILFRPFVNIFSAGSSKLNYKCQIAIPGKNFFEKSFGQFRSLSECVSVFSRKKFNRSLQKFVLCAHMKFMRKILLEIFFLNLFGKRTKFCRPNANNFQQSVQTAFYVTWEQFEEAFSLKNSWFCFSIVFWHLVTIFRSFAESFSWPLSEPLFDFPKELFEKIVHRKLFFLLHNERKILAFHRKKFSRIPRNGILGVQRPNLEKNVFLFWKKNCFFSNASVPR